VYVSQQQSWHWHHASYCTWQTKCNMSCGRIPKRAVFAYVCTDARRQLFLNSSPCLFLSLLTYSNPRWSLRVQPAAAKPCGLVFATNSWPPGWHNKYNCCLGDLYNFILLINVRSGFNASIHHVQTIWYERDWLLRWWEPVRAGEMHVQTIHLVVFGYLCYWFSIRRDLAWLQTCIIVLSCRCLIHGSMHYVCIAPSCIVREREIRKTKSCGTAEGREMRQSRQSVRGEQTRQRNEVKQSKTCEDGPNSTILWPNWRAHTHDFFEQNIHMIWFHNITARPAQRCLNHDNFSCPTIN
jgi:hypothetical protein